MTRQKANEILSRHKFGLEAYPAHTITFALWITGDLDAFRAWDGR